MHLHFAVINQTLYYRQGPPVVADSQGYLVACFKFTGDWGETVKYAQFTRDGKTYSVALDGVDQCIVPWEVLVGEGIFYVNVFATNQDGKTNKFITANSVKIVVRKSGLPTGADPAEPSQGILGNVVSDAINEIKSQETESLIVITGQTETSLNSVAQQEQSSINALSLALDNAQQALNAIKQEVELLKENAAHSALNAYDSEQASANSAEQSKNSADAANTSALASKDSETASKGYYESTKQEAENAALSEQTALAKANEAAGYANEAKTNAENTQNLYNTFTENVADLTEEVHANTNARAGITATINDDGSLTLHKPD